jgi:tetratricopeptide (TPR) repeat protein
VQNTWMKRWLAERASRICLCLLVTEVLLLVGCATPQQKFAHHLEQAEHWAAAGKTNEAVLEYRRAIQINPKAAAPHLAIAKIFRDREDYINAYREASTVEKNDPGNPEAQLLMADLLFRTRNFAEALKRAQTLVVQKPNDAAAWLIAAGSALALQDKKVATSSVDRLLQLDARNSRAWYIKGMVQLLDQKNPESETSLEKAIQYGPDSTPPVTALAVSMLQRGEVKGAEKVIRDAVNRNPENVELHKLLAAFLLSQNRRGELQEVFRQIRDLGDNDPGTRGILARYYSYVGDRDAAMQEYQNVLKKHPDDDQNGLQLVAAYLEADKPSDSEKLLNDIAKRNPNDPKVLLSLGRWRLSQGRTEEAIGELLHASQLDSRSALPQYFLGLAYIRQGKLQLADASLNRAAQLDPNLPGPRLILAQLALDAGKPERAIATLDETLKSKPRFVEPYLLQAQALGQQGQYVEMEHAALPLVEQFPEPPARAMTYRTLAWAKFHQQRYNEAHTFAKESLKYESTSTESLYLLGASEIALKNADTGIAEVLSFMRSNPNWAPGYATLGNLQAMAGQAADAESSLRKSLTIDPTLITAQLSLASMELRQGKLDPAMENLRKLAQSHPDYSPAQVQMGQISELKDDWKSAETYYTKALTISPDDVVAKNNLAWLYAEHGGNIDVALKLAQDAKEAAPDNADISDTLGWIMLKKKNYGTAVQLLSDCVQRKPDQASCRFHLGIAYYYMGSKSEAERSLQAALKLEPDSPDAQEAKKILKELNN